MNTSVSPLPLPIWPMLALSLILVAATSVAVTFSAHHAAQVYSTASQQDNGTEVPAIFTNARNAHLRHKRIAQG